MAYKLIKGAVKNLKHKEEGKAILQTLEKNLPEDKYVEPAPEEKKEA